MKTVFTNKTKHFDIFTFDVLTSEELLVIKGGKSDDSYIEPK